MDYIKQYTFSICASGLFATLCYMILPNSNISKVVKTAISVFFLSALLSPWLLDFDILGEIERYTPINIISEYKEIEEKTDEYIIKQFELKIKELILNDLKSINVDPVNLIVSIDENEEGLFVDNVKVYIQESNIRYKTDVAIKIKTITQCQPEIYMLGG